MSESKPMDPANASVQDVADHFGVTDRTVRRWMATTDIPHRRVGKTVRFVLEEVDEWAAANGTETSASPA